MKVDNLTIRWIHNGYADFKHKHTQCLIIRDNMTFCGYALCSNKDSFSRDTGRKISLARALKASQIPKEERLKVWEAYRNMTVKKRW